MKRIRGDVVIIIFTCHVADAVGLNCVKALTGKRCHAEFTLSKAEGKCNLPLNDVCQKRKVLSKR